MKKALIITICLIFTVISLSSAWAKTKWDMHLNYPAGNFHSKGAQRFVERIYAATNGELKIVLHPRSALGFKGPELLRAVAQGQLAIAEVPTGMVEGDAPILALTAQPFISADSFEQRLLYWLARSTYARVLKKFNQMTLYTGVWPFSGIYSQRPIYSAADLKGLKMRVYDGLGLNFGKQTGIAARKMPFSEVYPAMKAGLLDSMYTSSVTGVDARAWEVFKYFTPINIVGPVNMINVNLDAWNKLPADIRSKVLEVAAELEDEMWNLVGDMDRKSRATLKKNGMTVSTVSAPFRNELNQIGIKLRDHWARKAGRDAQTILSAFYKERSLVAKHQPVKAKNNRSDAPLNYSSTSKKKDYQSKDNKPPVISLNRGFSVSKKAMKRITGQAIDESGVALVVINGKEARLDPDGYFEASILLKPGKNTVEIEAFDIYENQTTKTVVIEKQYTPVATPKNTDLFAVGKYFALLIAIEDYQSSTINDLYQPINDAYKIRNVLLKYTFDHENIILLKNPDRDHIIDEFDRLSQVISENDNLLIFYAGHGYWDKKFKQGYWLPSNASKNSRSKWLSNSTIRDYIRGIQTRHTLLVSDACFSGGIFKTRKAFDDAPLATNELYRFPSRKAMTSGQLSQVPDKSVFVKYFVKRLQENAGKYLSSEQLFVQFKDAVINNSPLRQVPQFGEIREAGDEGGDFIFVQRN